jgi:hypothetical protein
MYKNLTQFTVSDSPAAQRSLARVIIITYGKVESRSMSRLVAHPRIMKGKFDVYLL